MHRSPDAGSSSCGSLPLFIGQKAVVGINGDNWSRPLSSHIFFKSDLLRGAQQSHSETFPSLLGITHILIANPGPDENRWWPAIRFGSRVTLFPSSISLARMVPSCQMPIFPGFLMSPADGNYRLLKSSQSIRTSRLLCLPMWPPETFTSLDFLSGPTWTP